MGGFCVRHWKQYIDWFDSLELIRTFDDHCCVILINSALADLDQERLSQRSGTRKQWPHGTMCQSNAAMSTTLIFINPDHWGESPFVNLGLSYRVPQNPMVCFYVYLVQSNLKFWGRPPLTKSNYHVKLVIWCYMMLYDVIWFHMYIMYIS